MSNTAVMAFGEETTAKVAAMIASKLNADLIVNEKMLDGATVVVAGTHVRMGKFNKRYIRFVKKYAAKVRIYTFIVGAEIEKKQKYVDLAEKDSGGKAWYVWGELNANKAKGLKKFALQAFIDGRTDCLRRDCWIKRLPLFAEKSCSKIKLRRNKSDMEKIESFKVNHLALLPGL